VDQKVETSLLKVLE
jgi:hypothetical protein